MLDHYPYPHEIALAEQNFQMGHATCDDIEVLRFAHPWAQYVDCGCGDLFGFSVPSFLDW